MISKSKILAAFAGLAAIILVGIGLSLFLTRAPSPAPKPVPQPVTESEFTQTNVSALVAKPSQAMATNVNEMTSETSEEDTGVITNWDDKLDEILIANNTDTDEKAKQLLKIFPRLPEAGQIEAAQHLSNLLRDEDYPPLGRYLANSKTPVRVLDELMTDVLNRPNSMKLPLLLEVARNPNHPKATEAKETILQYLEKDENDLGSDWNNWEDAVKAKVKEDPD